LDEEGKKKETRWKLKNISLPSSKKRTFGMNETFKGLVKFEGNG
jgi:hypothetical protein